MLLALKEELEDRQGKIQTAIQPAAMQSEVFMVQQCPAMHHCMFFCMEGTQVHLTKHDRDI